MTTDMAIRALSDIDERFIIDADQTPVRRLPVKRFIAAAACLVLLCAAIGGFFAWQAASEPPLITSAALRDDADATLITSYPMTIDPCYASPRNGDVLLFLELEQALKHYENENVRFWVKLDIFSEDGAINFNEAETDAEVARLAALGYDLYTIKKDWIGYWGEDKHFTTICAKMSADELNAFEEVATDERYGYAFEFAPDEAAVERDGYEVEPVTDDAAERDDHTVESAPDNATDEHYGSEVEPATEDAAVAEK